MKPDEQRIAIALACGYMEDKSKKYCERIWNKGDHSAFGINELPNYLGDLNHIHEAEKMLDLADCLKFRAELQRMENKSTSHFPCAERHAFHASAAQRSEAFLKTFKLWAEQ